MDRFKMRFSIRHKIFLACMSLFSLLLITVIVTMIEVSGTRQFTSILSKTGLPLMENVEAMSISLGNSVRAVQRWLLEGDQTAKKRYQVAWTHIDEYQNKIGVSLETTRLTLATNQWGQAKKLLSEIKLAESNILALPPTNEGRKQGVELLKKTINPKIIKLQRVLGHSEEEGYENKGLIMDLKNELHLELKNIRESVDSLMVTQWIMLGIGIVFSFIITWVVSSSVVNPIQRAIDFAKRLAGGERNIDVIKSGNDETYDLSLALDEMQQSITRTETALKENEKNVQELYISLESRVKNYLALVEKIAGGDLRERVEIEGDDDLSKLGDTLNKMTDSLGEITGNIASCANQITVGLSELENTAMTQASSATEQASSVSETTSVIEEIKATSSQTLEKASALGDASDKTAEQGEKGRQSISEAIQKIRNLQQKMKEIVDTILGLSSKTQLIGEITDVVSGLSKQSKLLALNASIEAAKAGEAGKGFAVVAGEVKELAEQSQQSTDRVQKILQDIRETTERAVTVTEEGSKEVLSSLEHIEGTGTVIDSLGNIIQQSSVASKQIVAAVRQESAGIEQIVLSIAEIDKVTKQFMEATEQTKQAAVGLADVSSQLRNSVSIYKISIKGEGS